MSENTVSFNWKTHNVDCWVSSFVNCICSGYMSPEYAMEGIFSVKSDVFSFGVLVLEIVSGKRNRGFHNSGQDNNLLGYVSLNRLSFLFCLVRLITQFFLSLLTDVGELERRKRARDRRFDNCRFLIINVIVPTTWSLKMHTDWSFMCSRTCRGQTKDVVGGFNAR